MPVVPADVSPRRAVMQEIRSTRFPQANYAGMYIVVADTLQYKGFYTSS